MFDQLYNVYICCVTLIIERLRLLVSFLAYRRKLLSFL